MNKVAAYFRSSQSDLSHRIIFTSAVGAFVALLTVAAVSRFFLSDTALPFLIASMGASAVILFAVPSSPMAKPWSVIGGHIVSAVTGVFCYQAIGDLVWAAPVTIAAVITLMLYLRCLHPPGGATALVAVTGGAGVHELGYQFVLTPVAINALIIIAIGVLFRQMLAQLQSQKRTMDEDEWWDTVPSKRTGLSVPFTQSDLDTAMQHLDTYVDVTKTDLLRIYSLAALHAMSRNMEESHCREIMKTDVIKAEYSTELGQVWAMFKENNIRCVPVIDRVNHLIGIVTVSDFVTHAASMGEGDEKTRLKRLVKRTEGMNSNKPEVAGQIMSTPVHTLGPNDVLSAAIEVLKHWGIHHLPIVDEKNKLLGMVSHTDLPAIVEITTETSV